MSATDEEKAAITQPFSHEAGNEDTPSSALQRIPKRYILAVMAFFGFANVYALRVNLSVAIVAMVRSNPVVINGTIHNVSDFDWDSKVQGRVLSAFFWGYIFTQIPGGLLAKMVGGKFLFGGGILATGILTIITPPVAHLHVYLLIAVRIVEGFFEGVTYPVMHVMWSKWAPPIQRSSLVAFAFSGAYFGTVISMPLSAVIADVLGWAWVFYIFGMLAIVWFLAWCYIVSESPADHPTITKAELTYIQSAIGFTNQQAQKQEIPWRSMFLSLPMWAIVVAHFCENWGFYTMLTELPTFLNNIMHYDLYKAGFLSAIPYAVMCVAVLAGGQLADLVRRKGLLSTTGTRKLFNCVAFLWQGIFLVAVAYTMTPAAAVFCISLAVGVGGFAWSGFSVNHLDIAPQLVAGGLSPRSRGKFTKWIDKLQKVISNCPMNWQWKVLGYKVMVTWTDEVTVKSNEFASILMGISNTAATLPGIFSPLLTGYIIQDKTTEEWQIVFYLAAGVYGVGALVYFIFASGELQPWAEMPMGYAPHVNTPEPAEDAETPDLEGRTQ